MFLRHGIRGICILFKDTYLYYTFKFLKPIFFFNILKCIRT